MFIEFQVGNFRSFRDAEKLTMLAAPMHAKDNGLDEENVLHLKNYRLLKTKAIYGSNASGKSNIVKAINAFTGMVSQSVRIEELTGKVWEDRFKLLTDWDEQPIFFQYIFSLNNITYRYGFQILESKIIYEWLFGTIDNDEIEFFMRGEGGLHINDQYFIGAGTYIQQALDEDNEIFRSDALFLTAAALSGNKFAGSLRNEIRSVINVDGVNDDNAVQYAMTILGSDKNKEKKALINLITAADTGIENLEIRDLPDTLIERFIEKGQNIKLKAQTIFSTHSVYNEDGLFIDKLSVPFAQWESEGTGKLLGIGALVLEVLKRGSTIIIDEFDARFHPNLTLKIVQLFNSQKTNPKNAQLIFVTHDSGLLRRAKFRRDQICLVDKDKYGISTLQTLIEYKGVRKDASYEKEYLQGNYAGVPFLDEIDWVISEMLNDNNELSETK